MTLVTRHPDKEASARHSVMLVYWYECHILGGIMDKRVDHSIGADQNASKLKDNALFFMIFHTLYSRSGCAF